MKEMILPKSFHYCCLLLWKGEAYFCSYHIYSIVSAAYNVFFSSFHVAYNQEQLRFFLYLIQSCEWHSVFPWPHFVIQTLFSHSLSSLQHHVHTLSQEGLWWTEGSYIDCCKHHYQGCQLNMKHASMRKYLRGLSNLCSSAAYSWIYTVDANAFMSCTTLRKKLECKNFFLNQTRADW